MVKNGSSLTSGYDREGSHLCFCGRPIFWDVETGIIWIESQVSFGADDTIKEKTILETTTKNFAYEQFFLIQFISYRLCSGLSTVVH